MTDQPSAEPSPATAYADLETPEQMHADCLRVGDHLRLEQAARRVLTPPPSLHFEDYPREVPKRQITVSQAAARLAAALHLHLD